HSPRFERCNRVVLACASIPSAPILRRPPPGYVLVWVRPCLCVTGTEGYRQGNKLLTGTTKNARLQLLISSATMQDVQTFFWGVGVAWLTRRPVKAKITGSNPALPATFLGGLSLPAVVHPKPL